MVPRRISQKMTKADRLLVRQLPLALLGLWVLCMSLSFLAVDQRAAAGASLVALGAMVAFGLIHGARRFGARGSLFFFATAVLVSNLYEHLSITTGFPFGLYVHNAVMGPKLFLVPLVIGPGYFGGCYLAWTLASALYGDPPSVGDRRYTLAVPIIATFIVVGWDICQDPLGGTVAHRWTYAHGGAFFGVPLSNFLGWFLVTWTIFQIFAFYLASTRRVLPAVEPTYWYQASCFWAAIALQFPVLLLTVPQTTVQDASGWIWRSGDIVQTAVITSIYTMLAAAVTSALVAARRAAITSLADGRSVREGSPSTSN
jgi:uncharacterized membrane protein